MVYTLSDRLYAGHSLQGAGSHPQQRTSWLESPTEPPSPASELNLGREIQQLAAAQLLYLDSLERLKEHYTLATG